MQYMKAVLLARTEDVRSDGAIVEVVGWELPKPLLPSTRPYKYRLYYGAGSGGRIRHENEHGNGDRRHIGKKEEDYTFTTIDQLLDDFERDIANWR